MSKFLFVAFGGALGTGARYLISGVMLRAFGTAFPYSTLVVNVVGSFLISIVMYVGLSSELISLTMKVVLATGVLGGFTTYSSYSYEMVQYFHEGEPIKGAVYFLGMNSSCLIAAWMGLALAKKLF